MRLFLEVMKNRTIVLLLAGLFSSIVSGYWGVVVGVTYVVEKSQYPQALKKYNPASIYIVYKGMLYGSSWRNTFFRGYYY